MENILLASEYLLLMISIFCIFNARGIVGNKVNVNKQNKYVNIVKVISTMFVILSLILIYVY